MTIFKTIFSVIVGLLSGFAFATENPSFQATSEQNADAVLPQLSFAAQQARALQLAKEAENVLAKHIETEKLQEASQRIQNEIGNDRLLLKETVIKVYLENNFQPLWTEQSAEKFFLREYAAFAASGISIKSAKAFSQILSAPPSLKRDILLTDSFLDYLYYSQNVDKFANQWLYKLGSYTTKSPDEQVILNWMNAVQTKTASQFVLDLIPKNHIYQQTIEQLFQMRADMPLSTAIAKEEKSTKKNPKKAKTVTVSLQKLALNAQRLRLIPSFHNGIFVNIPSYQLYYFRDGQLALQSKVIVGRNERRTPVMYSKLSNVVVNPPWNVPATIKNKDLVPKMRQDPSYVERNGYEIIDSRGNKVNPYSINWESYDPNKNFPYHLRQKAGDDSALGRYKFNMPSSDAIYLHDTPNRGLFGKTSRALSSGCVRVAKSDELATLLLKEAGWTEQRKQNVLASKKTTSAQIQSDNPVYLYYVTAWIENGKLHTLPDIYSFDTNIPKISFDWESVKSQFN